MRATFESTDTSRTTPRSATVTPLAESTRMRLTASRLSGTLRVAKLSWLPCARMVPMGWFTAEALIALVTAWGANP